MIFLGILFLALIVFIIVGKINKQQKVLMAEHWTQTEKGKFYFFKEIDSIQLENFTGEDMNVTAGTKVNGYTALTKTDMALDSAWVNKQIAIIDYLSGINAAENWSRAVALVMQSQNTGVSQSGSYTLSDIGPYVGMDAETLAARREVLAALNDGAARTITLQDIALVTNGTIFTSVNNRRKALNENLLPYLSSDLLSGITRLTNSTSRAVTVISNDHIFVVAVLDDDVVFGKEERMSELKTTYIEETGISEQDYYAMLVSRVDLLENYPTVSITVSDETADCYLVDTKIDGSKKLAVMVIKDSVSGFLEMDTAKGKVTTNDIYGYVVPKSAIHNTEGVDLITIMERTYFPEYYEVNVTTYDGNEAILSVYDNPDLSNGESYKVHP